MKGIRDKDDRMIIRCAPVPVTVGRSRFSFPLDEAVFPDGKRQTFASSVFSLPRESRFANWNILSARIRVKNFQLISN